MSRLLNQSPEILAAALGQVGRERGWIARDPAAERSGRLKASHPLLEPLAAAVSEWPDYRDHEAIFLAVGRRSGALFGAFLHRCARGQTQGGLRRLAYTSTEPFLRDGLRLALGMGRKCALAGLWWGGGKGLIADPSAAAAEDPARRALLYAEYAHFVTSLRGAYITAEDAGTNPADMAVVHRHTRFATCLPPEVGGSGNPSAMTADGVVVAMATALDALGLGTLEGKRIAMQGTGNVGGSMIERLLERGASVVASEVSAERRAELLDRLSCKGLVIRLAKAGDDSILAEECDVLAPNALGGVLNPKTIESVKARLVCGAANNILEDDDRDATLLEARGVAYVPDFLANRMGIVACCNEQYGSIPGDPIIARHLDADWEHGIPQVTRRVFEVARRDASTPMAAANRLADDRAGDPHPIFGDRAQTLVRALIEGGWDQQEQVDVDPDGSR